MDFISNLFQPGPVSFKKFIKKFIKACRYGDKELVQKCIAEGVNVNAKDDYGNQATWPEGGEDLPMVLPIYQPEIIKEMMDLFLNNLQACLVVLKFLKHFFFLLILLLFLQPPLPLLHFLLLLLFFWPS